jgi:ABC transporter substrate binding protein
VEGHNLAIEARWLEDQPERLPDLAAEMVRLQPDLLVTFSHRVALATKEATTTIPIVFVYVDDPVGLVASLAYPGANITGVSLQGLDLIGKQGCRRAVAVLACMTDRDNVPALPPLRRIKGGYLRGSQALCDPSPRRPPAVRGGPCQAGPIALAGAILRGPAGGDRP